MQGIGGFLFLMGAGSCLLNLMNYDFSLLMWIDNWGTSTGTAIRIGMIVVGAALWFIGNAQEKNASQGGPQGPVGPPKP